MRTYNQRLKLFITTGDDDLVVKVELRSNLDKYSTTIKDGTEMKFNVQSNSLQLWACP